MTSPFDGNPLTVSKFDAARRQLDTAIHLWFNAGDDVSILTLAHASHDIIHRLFRNHGFSDLMFDSKIIKDEFRGDFARMIKKAPNFFKHANNEGAESTVSFRPGYAPMFLMMSCYALAKIGTKLNDVELAAMIWFSLHHPSTQFVESLEKQGLPINIIDAATSRDKTKFFKTMTEVIQRRRREQ